MGYQTMNKTDNQTFKGLNSKHLINIQYDDFEKEIVELMSKEDQ